MLNKDDDGYDVTRLFMEILSSIFIIYERNVSKVSSFRIVTLYYNVEFSKNIFNFIYKLRSQIRNVVSL